MPSDCISALDKVHGQGILHRDMSLRNILLSDVEDEHVERDGLVIDLDCAIDNAIRSNGAAPRRTVSSFLPLQVLALLLTPYLGYVPVLGHRPD